MNELKVFEAFAGYGGASFGLKKAKIPHKVVGYSENDKFAVELYEANHPGIQNFGDITKINPIDLPDFDLFTGGFPCQPFSSVGLGKGEEDTRGTLFHEILRICEAKKPKHVLLENVKGLLTRKHGKSFSTIINKLGDIGYTVSHALLNSKDYGIPQNRERVWIYGSLDKRKITLELKKQNLTRFFKEFLDKTPDEQLFKNQAQVLRLKELYNLDFNVPEPSCADLYNRTIRTDGICITILEPHHNKLRVVHPPASGVFRVRKLSVSEHFRLMGFTDGEINTCNQSYQQLCKRAANGWDINVTSKILNLILNQ
jgi:DNA (cytosine-5)-methyltransferase 1